MLINERFHAGDSLFWEIVAELAPLGQDVFLANEAGSAEEFLPLCVVKNLSRNHLDPVLLRFFRIFPGIDEHHVHPTGILPFKLLKYRRHDCAGDAFVCADIDQTRELFSHACAGDTSQGNAENEDLHVCVLYQSIFLYSRLT